MNPYAIPFYPPKASNTAMNPNAAPFYPPKDSNPQQPVSPPPPPGLVADEGEDHDQATRSQSPSTSSPTLSGRPGRHSYPHFGNFNTRSTSSHLPAHAYPPAPPTGSHLPAPGDHDPRITTAQPRLGLKGWRSAPGALGEAPHVPSPSHQGWSPTPLLDKAVQVASASHGWMLTKAKGIPGLGSGSSVPRDTPDVTWADSAVAPAPGKSTEDVEEWVIAMGVEEATPTTSSQSRTRTRTLATADPGETPFEGPLRPTYTLARNTDGTLTFGVARADDEVASVDSDEDAYGVESVSSESGGEGEPDGDWEVVGEAL